MTVAVERALMGSDPEPAAERRELVLALPDDWKVYTPREFAWRPSKWGLAPAPGFGGPLLGPEELNRAGLAEGTSAFNPPYPWGVLEVQGHDYGGFKVQYLVTRGENKRFGVAAAKAGIREGMIVLGANHKRDFDSLDHFHAWWRLTVPLKSEVGSRGARTRADRGAGWGRAGGQL